MTYAFPAQVLRELCQTTPLSCVHVLNLSVFRIKQKTLELPTYHMLLVANVFIVKLVRADPFFAVRGLQKRYKVSLKVVAETCDVLARIFTDNLHLSDVRLRLDVAFKSVGIATLLLADFTPPSEALQAF